MKRMFKSTISLLLIAAFLLTPLVGTTASAVGEISSNVTLSKTSSERSVSLGEFEGAFYLRNPHTGRYIDIKPSATAPYNGTVLEQWAGDFSSTQKWIFTEVRSGTAPYYYTIMNVETGLYMTVKNNSSSNDADVILESLVGTGSIGQLWTLEATSGGRYKIYPKCAKSKDRVLCVNDALFGATGDGLNIKSRTYTDNSNYKDEWCLEFCGVYLEFSYDQGYIEMHREDTDPSNTVVKQRINSFLRDPCFSQIAAAFLSECKIPLFNKQPTFIDYSSNADECESCSTLIGKNKIQHSCGCISYDECILQSLDDPHLNNEDAGFLKDCHCKSSIRLRNNLITGIPEDTIRITYTGHGMCYRNQAGVHEPYIRGLAEYNHPIIAINFNQENLNKSVYILAHELTHTYGAYHHYGVGDPKCVMYAASASDEFDMLKYYEYWCDECLTKIKNNANKY